MANPTTNFGWVMPASTDLVTDLPADFAVFGQAVDTSLAELKGGTTGQLLSKTSNTDMDFTWATPGTGGLTLITRASYSGVATTGTTFDSVFSATYKSYMVVIESHYAATGTDAMHMQFRYSATTQALTYYSTSRSLDSAAALASQAVSNGAQCVIHSASGSSVAPMSGALYFHQIGNGSSKPLFHGMGFVGIGNPGQFVFGGFQDTARSYDGFILKSASTNITGTISVYGLATA